MFKLNFGVLGYLGKLRPQPVGLGAAPADDDARASGVHVDAQPVAGALYFHAADRGPLELPVEVLPDMDVLDQVVLVLAVGEPP